MIPPSGSTVSETFLKSLVSDDKAFGKTILHLEKKTEEVNLRGVCIQCKVHIFKSFYDWHKTEQERIRTGN